MKVIEAGIQVVTMQEKRWSPLHLYSCWHIYGGGSGSARVVIIATRSVSRHHARPS